METRLLITIDTEALPARAADNHIDKLIWGEFDAGRAGIIEICDAIEEFGGKGLFFLDVAGSFKDLAAYREVNSYLERRGHFVEWHYHPEIMGRQFWLNHGASAKTMRQDLFDAVDTKIILSAGLSQFIKITGRRPSAYRAGSFRWNNYTVDFLSKNNIPYSFNACRETSVKPNYATYFPPSPAPFLWPQGVREIPCGEVVLDAEIVHFRFPRRFPRGVTPLQLADALGAEAGGLVNMLLHSWSLLERDQESGHFYYKNDSRVCAFRSLLRDLSSRVSFISDFKACLES